MSLAVQCPTCTRELTVPDRLLGRKVKCPKCETMFQAGFAPEPMAANVVRKVQGSMPPPQVLLDTPAGMALVICQGCTKQLSIPEKLLGKTVKCPRCSTLFQAKAMTPDDTETLRMATPPSPPAVPEVSLAVEEGTDDVATPQPQKARKRKRREETSSALPYVIGGGVALFVLLLALLMWWLWPSGTTAKPGDVSVNHDSGARLPKRPFNPIEKPKLPLDQEPPPENPPQNKPDDDPFKRDRPRRNRPGNQPPPQEPPGEVNPDQKPDVPPQVSSALGMDGLIAYWTFDEGQGRRFADASTSGINGTLLGEWAPGVRGTAFQGNGQSTGCELSYNVALNFDAGAPFTFSGWFQALPRGRGKNGTILSFRANGNQNALVDILLDRNGQLVSFVRSDSFVTGESSPHSTRTEGLDDGKWHHFALIRQPGDGGLELFVDGQSVAKDKQPGSQGAITTDLRAIGVELFWLRFERNKPHPSHPNFEGLIDEVSIFNRALQTAEIRRLAGK